MEAEYEVISAVLADLERGFVNVLTRVANYLESILTNPPVPYDLCVSVPISTID